MPHEAQPPAAAPHRGRRTAAHGLTGFAALLVMLFAIPHAGAAFKYLKVGMEVPDFALKTLAGEEFGLARVKEHPATLLVFFATWSPRSTPALVDAQKLYDQYAGRGFSVVAVNVNRPRLSTDDIREIEELKTNLKLTVPIVIDEGLETYNAFGVVATPSVAVVDNEGKVVHEAASYLQSTGDNIRQAVEILLGVREAPKADAVAAKPVYKPDSKALRHFNFGRVMLQRGNKDKAIEQLKLAAAADHTYAAPLVFLGHLLLGKHDPASVQQAAEYYAAAAAIAPDDVTACTGRGEALLEQGKLDEALAVFEKAVALDPTYTPAVSNLALVLAKQGKPADAEVKFKAALELNPLDAGTHFRRALGSEAGGDLKRAAVDFRRALEILMNLPPTGDEV